MDLDSFTLQRNGGGRGIVCCSSEEDDQGAGPAATAAAAVAVARPADAPAAPVARGMEGGAGEGRRGEEGGPEAVVMAVAAAALSATFSAARGGARTADGAVSRTLVSGRKGRRRRKTMKRVLGPVRQSNSFHPLGCPPPCCKPQEHQQQQEQERRRWRQHQEQRRWRPCRRQQHQRRHGLLESPTRRWRRCGMVAPLTRNHRLLQLPLLLLPTLAMVLLLGSLAGAAAKTKPGKAATSKTPARKVYLVSIRGDPPLSTIPINYFFGPGQDTRTTARSTTTGGGSSGGGSSSSSSSSSSREEDLPMAAASLRYATRAQLQRRAHAIRSMSQLMDLSHVSAMGEAKVPPAMRLHSYHYLFNGFAALLSEAEAEALQELPQVVSVEPTGRVRPLTSYTPSLLRLPQSLWADVGGPQNAGEDVVVGVVDSGVWPENPAFANSVDNSFGPAPARWQGSCVWTADFPGCNGKLVGARMFYQGFQKSTPAGVDLSRDFLSPRDVTGHGTHTTSTAAGNHNYSILWGDQDFGKASGMAPRARLAVYKVYWRSEDVRWDGSANTADVIAAVDAAAADGVDVINFSGGSMGNASDAFSPMEVIFLVAARAGIFSAVAAGNAGPPPIPRSSWWSTLAHTAPWVTTVAACTHDRSYSVNLELGNGQVFEGKSMRGKSGPTMLPLIYGRDAAILQYQDFADWCKNNTLNATRVAGKIVVCTRGINSLSTKARIVQAAGGVGMVVVTTNVSEALVPEFYAIPTTLLSDDDGRKLAQYMTGNASPLARIGEVYPVYAGPASGHPVVAAFSSTGPLDNPMANTLSGNRNSIIKPDVCAPGVNIWAAWTAADGATSPGQAYINSGTSMATPHVAGIAALLRQRYPRWTPFAIGSALQTTATVLNTAGKPILTERGPQATPFEMGSGFINLRAAADPGLVYDETVDNMIAFLVGISYSSANASLFGWLPLYEMRKIAPHNLNLPTIGAAAVVGNVTVVRTVKNVGSVTARYTSQVEPPPGVRVQVVPPNFTILPGRTVQFRVTLTVVRASQQFQFGALTWVEIGGRQRRVRSAIAVQPLALVPRSSGRRVAPSDWRHLRMPGPRAKVV